MSFEQEVKKGFRIVEEEFQKVDEYLESLENELSEVKKYALLQTQENEELRKRIRITRRVQGVVTLLTTGIGIAAFTYLFNKTT